jgi:HK97 family phage prohead protease
MRDLSSDKRQLLGVSVVEFKSMLRQKQAIGTNIVILKSLTPPIAVTRGGLLSNSIVLGSDDSRRLRFTCSTNCVDRDDDVIVQEGWDIGKYEVNPVFCWQHDTGLPIGKALHVGVIDGMLKATFEMNDASAPEVGGYAELALQNYRRGFLSAVSVGFRPLEYEIAKDRGDEDSWFPAVNFLRSELYEVSAVTVPANPDALIDASERLVAIEAAAIDGQAAMALETETRRRAAAMIARKRRALEARLIGIGR